MITDHVEVTIDDLFVEHFDPPEVPPKTSSAMKGPRRHRNAARLVPHPTSLVGIGLIGAAGLVLAGAGFVAFRRWIA